jgi:Flp pilus assembly protein TadD
VLPGGGGRDGALRPGRHAVAVGRHQEAYRHLRYYTEISPELTWTWCWYGRAAEALGLDGEARSAYRRAVELEDASGPATGADDLLDKLEARRARNRRARRRRWPRR